MDCSSGFSSLLGFQHTVADVAVAAAYDSFQVLPLNLDCPSSAGAVPCLPSDRCSYLGSPCPFQVFPFVVVAVVAGVDGAPFGVPSYCPCCLGVAACLLRSSAAPFLVPSVPLVPLVEHILDSCTPVGEPVGETACLVAAAEPASVEAVLLA